MPGFLSPLGIFAGNGALGVSIFFLLSGFLIYSLSSREYQKTQEFDWKQFYIRRVLRIFPCFYFYVFVILALAHLGRITVTDRTIVSAATFTLNYHHLWDRWPVGLDYPVIGHYWTLALEEQFYLMWPLLMLLLVRRKLVAVLTGLIVVAPLIGIVSFNLLCVIGMGLFSYYLIEKPFLKLKDHFHKPRRTRAIETARNQLRQYKKTGPANPG
jgi:peptidoglycan/LPS O-acetylase OafA/YrhL